MDLRREANILDVHSDGFTNHLTQDINLRCFISKVYESM
jgi:hypothetical protein